MRALILVAGAALSLAACGSNRSEAENADANMMVADNLSTMDANMMATDTNMMGGADGNMMTNSTTESNMMAQDMNTNAPDTNLANGM